MTPFKKSKMSLENVHKVIRCDILVNIYVLFGIYEAKLSVLYGLYRITVIVSAETKTRVKTGGCVAGGGREGNKGNYGRIGCQCRLAKESAEVETIDNLVSAVSSKTFRHTAIEYTACQPRQPISNCHSPFSFFFFNISF